MGIAVSLILIAAGAILTWAVNADPEGLDVNVIGVVLMIVGLVSFILTLLFWQSWWGRGAFGRTTYEEGVPAGRRPYGGRRATYVEEDVPTTTYVEEEVPPGPGPPAPPP